jgi:Na+/proline symporter
MLSAVVITIFLVSKALNLNLGQMYTAIKAEGFTNMIISDFQHPRFFLKQFFAGMFITIVMTGLDQDMMQKNLSCRNLKDARKNVLTFGVILIPVNLMFLFLGAVLWLYADQIGITLINTSDELFPTVALNYLGIAAGITFFFGLVSAAYSSIDGTLTALTTTFCIDFLGLKRKPDITEEKIKKTRYVVHASFAFIVMVIIWLYGAINDDALISRLFTIAGYTYGPLLGLFAFGLFTKLNVKDRLVPCIAVASPLLSYIINVNSEKLLWGYKFGFEILLLNGAITMLGLLAVSKK